MEFATDPQLLNLSLSLAQEACLRAMYAEPLTGDGLDVYRCCTGRTDPPLLAPSETTVIAGARGGKDSRILAPVICYEAAFGGHERYLHRGERAVIPLVAQDQRATGISRGYIFAYFRSSPLLRTLIENERTNELDLLNRTTIACFPCTKSSLRGWSNPAAGLNELAFWRLEGSADSDAEVQASVRRGMLSFPRTKLIKISTPYVRSGVLYDDFQRGFGQDDPDLLVWRASSALMNPTITPERLDRERRLDPSRFQREYEAEFAEETDAFLPYAWVDDAVQPHRYELPPRDSVQYHAAVDPSGGGPDAFTVAVCHNEGTGMARRVVVDAVKGWSRQGTQGVDLTGVIAEIAALLRRYRITRVMGDRYAGQWVPQAFSAVGITYRDAPMDKSAAFLELEPLLAEGRIELLDHPLLAKELKNLERRLRAGGRVLVDHPHGGHDDYATAMAFAAVACRQAPTSTLTARQILSVGDDDDLEDERLFYRPGSRF